MLLLLELTPLTLDLMVCLKFGIALDINNTKLHEIIQHLVEDERKDALALILRLHRHQQMIVLVDDLRHRAATLP